nr:MAG TPA: hypothetical protein [Caudoviricetes sp.]
MIRKGLTLFFSSFNEKIGSFYYSVSILFFSYHLSYSKFNFL